MCRGCHEKFPRRISHAGMLGPIEGADSSVLIVIAEVLPLSKPCAVGPEKGVRMRPIGFF